jgi:hypothetical protein
MNTQEAIRLLSKHGATEEQMVAVLMATKVSAPSPGYKKVFNGSVVEFVRQVVGRG